MNTVQPIRDTKKIKIIRDFLKKTNLRNYALFEVGIRIGLRISDLLELKWKDVLENEKKFKDRIIIKEEKTEKTKSFFLQEDAVKALKEYMSSIENLNTDWYIFKSRKGENRPIDRFQAHKIISEAAQVARIADPIGTHSLRKTFGYHAYKQGTDIVLLMDVFNHSTPSMTKKYIGITDDDIKDVYINLKL